MLCLAQYSRRVIPLWAKPLIILRISCLLRILPFSAASIAQSRWVPQTLTLQRAKAAGVTWPLKNDWDEDRPEGVLFGGPPRLRPAALPMPDFAELHKQRQCHPHLTQQLL